MRGPILPAFSNADEKAESELFQVAQNAFEDGFYDVAIRYIKDLQENYPTSEKRNQANGTGQIDYDPQPG